jgi:hypothetical protein
MSIQHKKDWAQAKHEAQCLVDKRGMPIDPGILDTVAILRALGVNTHMSCEGHLDRGYGPYVSFEALEAGADRKKLVELRRKHGLPDRDDPEIVELSHKMNREEIAEREKVLLCLEEFYAARTTPHLYHLAVENLGFLAAVLRCQGAVFVNAASLKTIKFREEMLARQQREMKDFTAFLKSKAYVEQKE